MRTDVLVRAWRHVLGSFTARLVLLAAIFIAVPLILYDQLHEADEKRIGLLRDTVVQQDHLVVEVLEPYIRKFQQDNPGGLQETLDRLAANGTNIKILYRPKDVASEGFFYIASSPALSPEDLERERAQLAKIGVFDRVEDSCGNMPELAARFTNPRGREELLTSLTSLNSEGGCWVIVTSRSSQTFLQTAMDRPYWQASNVQIAAVIYALSAALVIWLIADSRRSIARFRSAARKIRMRGGSGPSFRGTNTIPELAGVAEDFDALIAALIESREVIRRMAEENAHALKTPLGIIAHSVEPLKRVIPEDHAAARRNLDIIEHSVERLDGLVTALRELDQASADTIYPRRWRLDLSAFAGKLFAAYGEALARDGKHLHAALEPHIHVLANEDSLESALENIVENAAGFTAPGGRIDVSLRRTGRRVTLVVADEGPGIEAEYLGRMFDRGFTRRQDAPSGGTAFHCGLGLWIARRNIEGVGGSVRAETRTPSGLAIVIELPAAD